MATTKSVQGEIFDKDLLDDGSTGVEQEDLESDEAITEPFDPTSIRVETKALTIDLLLGRISKGEVDMAPDFQRKGGIWTVEKQSRLIESLLIRIPLPAFYFDATDDDKWLVIDGLQRLTALKRFQIDQDLPLCRLEFLRDLNGKTYDELSRNFQRRIQETQVTVYLIQEGTPAAVKFNIFKRINTGGLPLSAQEIRHALNQGQAADLLKELAETQSFKEATSHGIRDKRMADRECVLRFLAFALTDYQEYSSKDFDTFLNDTMARINKMPKEEFSLLKTRFIRSMKAARSIFDRHAFRKLYSKGENKRPINKALFEAWSVCLDNLDDEDLKTTETLKEDIVDGFIELMNNDHEFEIAISSGTGDSRKIKKRFGAVENLVAEVLQ